MMKFKKFAFAALAGAMAFGMTSGVQAMATEPTPPAAPAFDKDAMTVKMQADGDFWYLQVLKENKADSKVSASYCVETDVVDLSFIKLSKDVYVRFFTNQNTTPSQITTIKAQPKAPKVKFVSGKDDLKSSFTLEGAALSDDSLGKLEFYDSVKAKWVSFSTPTSESDTTPYLWNLISKQYCVTGKELKVRLAAKNGGASAPSTPASLETKVKIPAAKKAPAVKLDYVKGVISFPKGTEAMVIGANNNGTFTYAFSAKTDLTPADFKSKYNEALDKVLPSDNKDAVIKAASYKVFVRTAAVVGKSNPSQWAMVDVKEAPTLAQITANTKYGKADASNITLESKDDGLVLKPTYASADKYQFAYSIDGGKKWTAIKAETKLAYSKIPSDKKIKLRINGVKEDTKKSIVGSWPSAAVDVTVTIPVTKVEVSGSAEISTGNKTYNYTATVKDALDNTVSEPAITWSISSGSVNGTSINDSTGVLTVGALPNADTKITIKAVSGGKEGTIEVTIKKAPAQQSQQN